MPLRSILKKLPDEIRSELDKKLRLRGYGGHIELAQWLQAEHGVSTSRSALSRYSIELKAKERTCELIARDMRDDLANREVVDLLLELGALRIKEHRILQRLEEIGYMPMG